jgi:leader peptidase (prepilin peptidase)/N-methyltransferase
VPIVNDPLALGCVCGILGLIVGSFLNVVIHRLPRMMEREWHAQCAELKGEAAPPHPPLSLAAPRSQCPHCGHMIAGRDNIPIVSYVLLRGRCRNCGTAISIRYPAVEALSGLLFGFAGWYFGPSWQAIGAILFVSAMIPLAFIDIDTQLLPDSITLPMLWLGLLFNVWNVFTELDMAVIGAMVGYLSLWTVYWLFKLATGKEGMGHGDFKLLAAIGAWLGWKVLPLTILLSSLVGAAVGLALIAFAKHGRSVPIPFGPYLAAAGVIALFWGHQLTESYLSRL